MSNAHVLLECRDIEASVTNIVGLLLHLVAVAKVVLLIVAEQLIVKAGKSDAVALLLTIGRLLISELLLAIAKLLLAVTGLLAVAKLLAIAELLLTIGRLLDDGLLDGGLLDGRLLVAKVILPESSRGLTVTMSELGNRLAYIPGSKIVSRLLETGIITGAVTGTNFGSVARGLAVGIGLNLIRGSSAIATSAGLLKANNTTALVTRLAGLTILVVKHLLASNGNRAERIFISSEFFESVLDPGVSGGCEKHNSGKRFHVKFLFNLISPGETPSQISLLQLMKQL